MTVAEWPAYIIRGIPHGTRTRMTERALRDDTSLADVVRLALCARYRMECWPASFGYQAHLDTSGNELLVRLQPDVWKAMRTETRGRYGETKKVVMQSISDYLEGTQ